MLWPWLLLRMVIRQHAIHSDVCPEPDIKSEDFLDVRSRC
jgi:hypothetical protein